MLGAIALLLLALALKLQQHAAHALVRADPVRTPGVLNPDELPNKLVEI